MSSVKLRRVINSFKRYPARVEVFKKRNAANLERLTEKAKHFKLKVIFLVDEIAKWQYQNLYELLEKNVNFEPLVVVSCNYSAHLGHDPTRHNTQESFDFFKNRGMRVAFGYCIETKKYIDLREFEADIIFYVQPWDHSENQLPAFTSNFALTLYSSYAITEVNTFFEVNRDFFSALYKYYIFDEQAKADFNNILDHRLEHIVEVTGHPKLDSLKNELAHSGTEDFKTKAKLTIIYAPHHSFLQKQSLLWGTFEWSGAAILKLVQRYPKFDWVLKPHPRFELAVRALNILSDDNYNKYMEFWKANGRIVTGGNYFDLFAESDLLITDCGSFLLEYLFTQKPVIHLISEQARPHSPSNIKASEAYYNAHNQEEFFEYFIQLAIQRSDHLKADRLETIKKFTETNASENILSSLRNALCIQSMNNSTVGL